MAQETEVVVFEVDVSSYEKSLADLTKSINGLKDTQADLQKQTKDGAKGAAESLEKVNAQLKLQQQEYRTTQNILVGYTGAQQKNVNVMDFSKNSIQANRDLLKQLTAQYINTTKPLPEFTKKIKDLSDKLKEQEGQIGDTRRNVGNYFDTFTKGVPQLGAAVEGVKNLGVAFKGAGGGVAGLAAGFASLGLPLLISGVNLLIGAFKDFAPLAEEVENIMGGLSTVFTSSYNEGVKLVKLKRQLEENDRNQIVTNAELKKSINELEAIAANKAGKDKERIQALEGANKLREQQLANDKEDAQGQLNLINLQVKQAQAAADLKASTLRSFSAGLINTTGKVSGELLTKQQEANAKLVELDDQFNQQTIANSNKIAQLKQSIEDESNEKSLAATKKTEEVKSKVRQEELKSLEDSFKKEQELKAKAEEDNSNRELNAQVVSAQITARRIGTVDAAIDAEIIAKNRLLQNESLTETERQNIIRQSEDKIAQIKKDSQEKTQEQAEQAAKKEFDTIVGIVSQVSNAVVGILSAVSSLIQQTAEQNIQSLQEQAGDGAAEQKRVATESRAIKLKAWKQAKAINITMAVMNTATAVMSQLSNPTPYVGFVLAALAAATGAIQIAMIAKQKPPSFALGGKVVSIGGKSHSEGGTPIHVGGQHVAEAEAGEGLFVMKKDAYNDIQMLSGWNQRYGGRSFTGSKTRHAADGGEIQIPSDGGFSTRSIRSATDNAMQVEMAIMNGFKKAPAPELSIVELNSKQTSRNRSVDVVSL